MLAGKCPSCGQFVMSMNGHVVSTNFGGTTLKTVTFHCPYPMCNVILGCQVDPLMLKSEMVQEIEEKLGA